MGLGASEKIQEETRSCNFSGMIYSSLVSGGSGGSKYFAVVRENNPEPKVAHSEGRQKYGHEDNNLRFSFVYESRPVFSCLLLI